jgi:hypothetical protein
MNDQSAYAEFAAECRHAACTAKWLHEWLVGELCAFSRWLAHASQHDDPRVGTWAVGAFGGLGTLRAVHSAGMPEAHARLSAALKKVSEGVEPVPEHVLKRDNARWQVVLTRTNVYARAAMRMDKVPPELLGSMRVYRVWLIAALEHDDNGDAPVTELYEVLRETAVRKAPVGAAAYRAIELATDYTYY